MDFREFLLLIRSKKTLLIGVPLLVGTVFLFITALMPTKYESKATLMVTNLEFESNVDLYERFTAEQELIKTAIRLMYNESFLLAAANKLALPVDTDELYSSIKIANPESSNLITIRVLSDKSQIATGLVNMIIDQLPAKVNGIIDPKGIIVLDKTTSARSYPPRLALTLSLPMLLSLLWVLSVVMFMATRNREVTNGNSI